MRVFIIFNVGAVEDGCGGNHGGCPFLSIAIKSNLNLNLKSSHLCLQKSSDDAEMETDEDRKVDLIDIEDDFQIGLNSHLRVGS